MTQTTRESMRSALVSTIESFRPEALTLEVENILDDLLGAIDDQDEEDLEDPKEVALKEIERENGRDFMNSFNYR